MCEFFTAGGNDNNEIRIGGSHPSARNANDQQFGRDFDRPPFGTSINHSSPPFSGPSSSPRGNVDGRLRHVRLGHANADRPTRTTADPRSEMSAAIVRSFRRPQEGPEMKGSSACDLSRRTIDRRASTEALRCQCPARIARRVQINDSGQK